MVVVVVAVRPDSHYFWVFNLVVITPPCGCAAFLTQTMVWAIVAFCVWAIGVGSALPATVPLLESRRTMDVFVPQVLYPYAGTVWRVNETRHVTWCGPVHRAVSLGILTSSLTGTYLMCQSISQTRLGEFCCVKATGSCLVSPMLDHSNFAYRIQSNSPTDSMFAVDRPL
jgi:hypothetical protein